MIIKNLSFKFDQNSDVYFFKNVQVAFAPHALNFIQGDNGCGKSTLFSLLQGLWSAQSFFEATFELDTTRYTVHENKVPAEFTDKVHAVQQKFDRMLAPQFTFLQNVQLAAMAQYPSLSRLPQEHLFDIEGVRHILDRPVHLLSGGQRQILAIIMALQKPTQVLLLDEPTATLDKKNAHLVMHILRTLSEKLKITMLIICHDKQLIDQYAQGQRYVLQEDEQGNRVLLKC